MPPRGGPAGVSDVVVTVPKRLWAEWLEEGDLARHDRQADWVRRCEHGFKLATPNRPTVTAGERIYIVVVAPDTVPAGTQVCVSDGAAGQRFRGSDGAAWANLG